MTIVNPNRQTIREIVRIRTSTGIYPGLPIEGADIGSPANFVVFGVPDSKGIPVAAQIIRDVPFGSRGGEGRKSLLPYWDMD